MIEDIFVRTFLYEIKKIRGKDTIIFRQEKDGTYNFEKFDYIPMREWKNIDNDYLINKQCHSEDIAMKLSIIDLKLDGKLTVISEDWGHEGYDEKIYKIITYDDSRIGLDSDEKENTRKPCFQFMKFLTRLTVLKNPNFIKCVTEYENYITRQAIKIQRLYRSHLYKPNHPLMVRKNHEQFNEFQENVKVVE
jgi:hypothetical protein